PDTDPDTSDTLELLSFAAAGCKWNTNGILANPRLGLGTTAKPALAGLLEPISTTDAFLISSSVRVPPQRPVSENKSWKLCFLTSTDGIICSNSYEDRQRGG